MAYQSVFQYKHDPGMFVADILSLITSYVVFPFLVQTKPLNTYLIYVLIDRNVFSARVVEVRPDYTPYWNGWF